VFGRIEPARGYEQIAAGVHCLPEFFSYFGSQNQLNALVLKGPLGGSIC